MTPCAAGTLAHCGSPSDVVRLDLGRDRGQDQVLAHWPRNHSALQQQTVALVHFMLQCLYYKLWSLL